MKPIYTSSFNIAVKEVLSMMAGLDLGEAAPYKLDKPKVLGQISSTIGIYGPGFEGAVIAHFNKPLAFQLLDSIFGIKTQDLSGEIFDAVGEVTNMICGRMKTELTNASGLEYTMTVPTIIVGDNYQTHIPLSEPAYVLPYAESGGEQSLNIEVKFREL